MGYWTGIFTRKKEAPTESTPPSTAPTPSPTATPARPFDLSLGNNQFPVGVAGESNYQSGIRRIAESVGRSCVVVLKPEPTNPFDKNAIVVTSQAGDTLGYLARGDAVDYADAFAILSAVNGFGLCHAKLIGGTAEKRSYGVLLDLREPADLLEYLAVQIAPLTPRPDSARPF